MREQRAWKDQEDRSCRKMEQLVAQQAKKKPRNRPCCSAPASVLEQGETSELN